MPSMRCLVCGGDETNVQKLHNFPRNPARSKEWQEMLGMKYTGDPLRSSKICNKHFSRDSYIDLNKFRLHRLAVPIPWLTSARTIETHKINMEASCSGIPSAECEKVSEIMTEVTVPQQTPSRNIRTQVNMEASCSGISSVQSAEEIVTEAASALEDRSSISKTPHLANCVLCESKLVSTNLDCHNTFISFKEWSDDKSKLIYPSEDFTIFIGRGITELEEFLNQFASHPLIVVKSENHLAKNLDFGDLGCPDHVVELKKLTLKSLCRIGIPWWCKRKNGEINEIRKEKRSLRRKINKFQH